MIKPLAMTNIKAFKIRMTEDSNKENENEKAFLLSDIRGIASLRLRGSCTDYRATNHNSSRAGKDGNVATDPAPQQTAKKKIFFI